MMQVHGEAIPETTYGAPKMPSKKDEAPPSDVAAAE